MDRIQYRRDTLDRWESINPVLMDGEVALVATDATKPNVYNSKKVGDGVHTFNELPMLGYECLQELGNNTQFPVSQKVVSENFSKLTSEIENFELCNGWLSGTGITRVDVSTYYAIKVIGGGVLTVKSNSGYASNVALVKDFIKNEVQELSFATGYNSRITINTGSTKNLIIPEDCKFILVNDKYTKTQDYTDLPDSIKINGYDYRKSLHGNLANEKTDKFVKYVGWISASSYSEKSDAYIWMLNIAGKKQIKIAANNFTNSNIAFLKTISLTDGISLDFATGYEQRLDILAGDIQSFEIPQDCKFLAVNGKYNEESPDTTPVSVEVDGYEIQLSNNQTSTILNTTKDLENKCLELYRQVDSSSPFSTYKGWVNSFNQIETALTRKLSIIKVNGGETITIKGSKNKSHIVFAKTFDINTVSFEFATGYSSRIVIGSNEEKLLFVPYDCRYILVNYSYDSIVISFPVKLEINGFDYAKSIRANVSSIIENLGDKTYPMALGEVVGRPDEGVTSFVPGTGYSVFTFIVEKGKSYKYKVVVAEATTIRCVYSEYMPSVGGSCNWLKSVTTDNEVEIGYEAIKDGYFSLSIWSANVVNVYGLNNRSFVSEEISVTDTMHNIDIVSSLRKGYGPTRVEQQVNSMLSIVHLTDSHNDWERVKRGFEVAKKYGCTLCHTGDIVVNSTDSIDELVSYVDKYGVRYLHCLGNHDSWSYGLKNQIYDKYIAAFKNKDVCQWIIPTEVEFPTYYYYDDETYKVRYIVIDQWRLIEEPNAHYYVSWSQEQIDFVISSLLSVPSGYGVIVLEHSPEGYIEKTDNLTKFYQQGIMTREISFNPINTIVDAFIGMERISTSIDTSREVLNINADFSNVASNEFITHISGHLHKDLVHYATNTKHRQLVLNETCTICKIANEGDNYAEVSDLGREIDTPSQDAFNVYAIDRANKCVKVVRIGSDLPNTFTGRRDYDIIKYIG